MSVDTVTVALAADDAFSRPLATAARSVLDTLDPELRLRVCVLDMGIEAANRRLIEASLASPQVEITWVDSLAHEVASLPNTWGYITRATYARLYLPQVLPDAERVLYLDCDVTARRSVADLFSTDLGGCAAAGVPDTQSPFVASPTGVPLWFDAGRSASEPNFNAGILLIDLAEWRRTGVTEAALDYLTSGRHHFAQDQEAINVVLARRILAVDPRWNQQTHVFKEEYAVTLPYDRSVVEQVRQDPWIVHFADRGKPWEPGYEHPFAEDWFASVDRTAYAGFRPKSVTRAQRGTTKGLDLARRAARRFGLLVE